MFGTYTPSHKIFPSPSPLSLPSPSPPRRLTAFPTPGDPRRRPLVQFDWDEERAERDKKASRSRRKGAYHHDGLGGAAAGAGVGVGVPAREDGVVTLNPKMYWMPVSVGNWNGRLLLMMMMVVMLLLLPLLSLFFSILWACECPGVLLDLAAGKVCYGWLDMLVGACTYAGREFCASCPCSTKSWPAILTKLLDLAASHRFRGGGTVDTQDKMCRVCYGCNSPFTMFRRRHHCRVCGQIFCHDCSPNHVDARALGINGEASVAPPPPSPPRAPKRLDRVGFAIQRGQTLVGSLHGAIFSESSARWKFPAGVSLELGALLATSCL